MKYNIISTGSIGNAIVINNNITIKTPITIFDVVWKLIKLTKNKKKSGHIAKTSKIIMATHHNKEYLTGIISLCNICITTNANIHATKKIAILKFTGIN